MTKILLVEDDKSLREIYGVRLLAEGYDIISAGDGEQALAMAIKDRPALIVSDVMMPKISGFDMLDILRSTTETRDIKVIMMTALSSEDQRKRGESLGADRYLVKSQVGIEDVVRVVHEVLGDAPTAASAAPTFTSGPIVQPRPVVSAGEAQPQPSIPVPVPQANPAANTAPFPQPTAPFSTQRPANLGDRIIQPLERSEAESNAATELAQRMNQELDGTRQPAAAPQPSMPTAEPSPQPTAPVSQPQPAPVAQPAPVSQTPAAAPVAPRAPSDDSSLASQMAAALEPLTSDQGQPLAPTASAQPTTEAFAMPAQPSQPASSAGPDLAFEETPRDKSSAQTAN